MSTPKVARTMTQVVSWLSKQGYALEHETAAAFDRIGFTTQIARPYRDAQEGKIRDIDVAVLAMDTPTPIWIAVECKAATQGAWLIRRAVMLDDKRRWRPIGSVAETGKLASQVQYLEASLPLGNPVGFTVVEAAPQDGAFGAINQAISGAVALAKSVGDPVIVLPVVVVDGPLFTVTYEGRGREVVEGVGRYRVLWSASPAIPRATAVDIVTRSELEIGVTRLGHEVGQLAAQLEDAMKG
jgi:hypothetical protein